MKNLLIIANSGRMLTQFAVNIAIKPLVIDCFLDADTQDLALECIKVDSLALEPVQKALSILIQKHNITHIVYGSGLESHLETLAFLNQKYIILGNCFDVFSAIQSKQSFFNRLIQLDIPHPETRFCSPLDNKNWLVKPLYGEGGIGVKKLQQLSQSIDSNYWQKYQPGQVMSVLFVADGYGFQVVGFNKQFVTCIDDYEFVFLSVISQPEISLDIVTPVTLWLKKLVKEFTLIGVNSLDFIVHHQQCYLLEINPRPSASMQLYCQDLLTCHMHPVDLSSIGKAKSYQGYQIVFADQAVTIANNILWPCWALDRPQQGTYIYTDMPICSIIAGGDDERQVQDLLLLKQQYIKKLIR